MHVDKLQFIIRSADKHLGKGVGEYIKTLSDYDQLNNIKQWRKIFSPLWFKEPYTFNLKRVRYYRLEKNRNLLRKK